MTQPATTSANGLTERQGAVMAYVNAVRDETGQTLSTSQIARHLGVRGASAERLLDRIRLRLGLHPRWPWADGPAPCRGCEELRGEVARLRAELEARRT